MWQKYSCRYANEENPRVEILIHLQHPDESRSRDKKWCTSEIEQQHKLVSSVLENVPTYLVSTSPIVEEARARFFQAIGYKRLRSKPTNPETIQSDDFPSKNETNDQKNKSASLLSSTPSYSTNSSRPSMQPVQAVQAISPVQPVHAVQPVQPIQLVQPVRSVQPIQAIQTVQVVQAIQPIQAIQPVQSDSNTQINGKIKQGYCDQQVDQKVHTWITQHEQEMYRMAEEKTASQRRTMDEWEKEWQFPSHIPDEERFQLHHHIAFHLTCNGIQFTWNASHIQWSFLAQENDEFRYI